MRNAITNLRNYACQAETLVPSPAPSVKIQELSGLCQLLLWLPEAALQKLSLLPANPVVHLVVLQAVELAGDKVSDDIHPQTLSAFFLFNRSEPFPSQEIR